MRNPNVRSKLAVLVPAVLGVAVLANFSQFGARVVLSAVLPSIIDAYSVSRGRIGFVLTLMWAVFALFQLPSGLLGDQVGEQRIIYVSLGSTAVASALLVFAPTFNLFALGVIFLGAGAGLYPVVSSSLLTKRFPERIGQTLSVHAMGVSFAGVVVPVAAVAISARFGWKSSLLLGVVFAVPSLALFVLLTPAMAPRSDRLDRETITLPELAGRLTRPPVLYTTLLAMVVMFVFQSFASFFPTFLVEYRSFSQASANTAFSAVFVLSAVLMPAIGRLSDVTTRDGTLASAMSVVTLGLVLLLVGPARLFGILGVVLVGIGFGWGGVLQSRFMDNFTDAERNSGFGVARTVYTLVGSLGSVTTGYLADIWGWSAAFGLLAVLLTLAVGSLVVVNVAGR